MKIFYGIPASEGRAGGLSAVFRQTAPESGEKVRTLEEAVSRCSEKLRLLYAQTRERLGEEYAEIFEAYDLMLKDPGLRSSILEYEARGFSEAEAAEAVLEARADELSRAPEEYVRQRAEDIRSLKNMLLESLTGEKDAADLSAEGEKRIVFAERMSPAQLMRLDPGRVSGIVLRSGGAASHVMILAKGMGIPAVTGFPALEEIRDGMRILLDGGSGEVICEPDERAVRAFREEKEPENGRGNTAGPVGEIRSADGQRVCVCVNIGSAGDLEGLDLSSVDGVGLYRTEFLFCGREREPSVEEQAEEYRKVFRHAGERGLAVRTMDLGGDKEAQYLDLPGEDNPFLGLRGIRLCLQRQGMLQRQFRALLLAAEGRRFSLMFPMIDTLEEFRQAKALWRQAEREARASGVRVSGDISVGVMIETPAAAICADLFAAAADFASLGTNDLTQYVMAADRGNPAMSGLSAHCAPAVVRITAHVIRTFDRYGKKLSLCGEAGADPGYLPLLLGMGLRYVSVSPSMAESVRRCISRTDCRVWESRAAQVMSMGSEEEIRGYLESFS